MDAPDTADACGSPRSDRRSDARALLLLLLVGVLLAARFLNGRLADWGGDNVQYLLLAEALATGAGYVDLHLPGTPFHTHYPPLFPLLLAPFVAAEASLLATKAWTALLSLAGLAVAFRFLRPAAGRAVALLCALATLCSAAFLDVALAGMSEGPYLLFSFAALGAMRRALAGPSPQRGTVLAAGLLAGVAILTRTIGLVLLPTAAFFLLFGARDRGAPRAGPRETARPLLLFGLAVAALTGPWFAAVVHHRGLDRIGYLLEFTGSGAHPVPPRADLLERPPINASDLGARLIDVPLPAALRSLGPPWTELALVAGAVLLAAAAALTALGFLRALAVRRGIEEAYVTCYGALLAFWLPGGFRLLVPILPILLLYLHDGAVLLAARWRAARFDPRWTGRAVLLLAVAANLAVVFTFPRTVRRLGGEYAPWWSNYLRTVCAVGAIAEPGDTIVAQPANVPYFLAGLQAAPLGASSREDLLEAVVASGARFVVLTPGLRGTFGREFAERVREDPERFTRVAGFGAIEAYAIGRDRPPEAAASDPQRWPPRCRAIVPPAPRGTGLRGGRRVPRSARRATRCRSRSRPG